MKKRFFPGERLAQFTHSIRFRLVLWFVLILGLVMVFFSVFIYIRQAQEIRSAALERLSRKYEHLFESSHEEDEESKRLQPVLSNQSTDSELDVVALQAFDGTILQTAGPLSAEQIRALSLPASGWEGVVQAAVPDSVAVSNHQYLFISPAITSHDVVISYLLAGVPLDANNQSGALLISLVLGNLLTLAIALSGGFWLADRAMRPVHTITHAAQQISETDLDKRLNLPGRDELSELASTFDGMLDRLQAAFERQRQFTADASHELRTPLTIIDLETSRALSNRRSVDEYERFLRTIQSENQFMVRLVNNLLALARMDAGQVSLQPELLDLSDLALEIIERLEPLARARNVLLEAEQLPETPARGDRPTLLQMLTNLVENGIKYSSGVHAPRVALSVGSSEKDGQRMAWLCVSDNGPGIATEHQQHLFDRFYQADSARSREADAEKFSAINSSSGTGLGLAIAQWIARAHQGDIEVESVIGQGSRFTVWLPIGG